MNKNEGVTIIELIVVIILIAILGAIIVPRFSGLQGQAKTNSDTYNAAVLQRSMEKIVAENGGDCPFGDDTNLSTSTQFCTDTTHFPTGCPTPNSGTHWECDSDCIIYIAS